MAILKLHYPGLQADEVLFVRAAMGRYQGAIQDFWGIPVHLIAYIGALKSWLYYPIFKVAGISTETIRLPMILLTGLGLYFLYLAAKKAFDASIALLLVFVLAIDTSLLTLTRIDIGPSAIEFFLKIAVLFCFVHFIKSKDIRWWLPIPVLMFAGIFNKLNFVWFFNSFIASALLIYWRNLWQYLKTEKLKNKVLLLTSGGIGFGMSFAYLVVMMIHYKIFGVKNDVHFFSSEFGRVFYLFRTIITGEQVQFIYGDTISILTESVFWISLLGVIAGVILNVKQSNSFFWFFFLNFILTLIQHYLTKESYNPWHAFTIQPFYTVCAVWGWVNLLKLLPNAIYKILTVSLISLLLYVRGELFYNFYQHHGKASLPYESKRPTDIIFSGNAFYDLVDFAKSNDKKMVLLGWATFRQLGIFTNQPERFFAAEELFHSPPAYVRNDEQFYERYLKESQNTYFVAEGDPNKNYELGLKLTPIFLEVLKKHELKPVIVKDISDGKDLIFRIYKVEKQHE